MALLRFSPQSLKDLGDIGDYIANDSPESAARFVEGLQEHCMLVAARPLIGRVRNEVRPGLRSVLYGRYLIFYRSIQDGAEIVRVIHSARDVRRAIAEG